MINFRNNQGEIIMTEQDNGQLTIHESKLKEVKEIPSDEEKQHDKKSTDSGN